MVQFVVSFLGQIYCSAATVDADAGRIEKFNLKN
jgi:hypothetical protein